MITYQETKTRKLTLPYCSSRYQLIKRDKNNAISRYDCDYSLNDAYGAFRVSDFSIQALQTSGLIDKLKPVAKDYDKFTNVENLQQNEAIQAQI